MPLVSLVPFALLAAAGSETPPVPEPISGKCVLASCKKKKKGAETPRPPSWLELRPELGLTLFKQQGLGIVSQPTQSDDFSPFFRIGANAILFPMASVGGQIGKALGLGLSGSYATPGVAVPDSYGGEVRRSAIQWSAGPVLRLSPAVPGWMTLVGGRMEQVSWNASLAKKGLYGANVQRSLSCTMGSVRAHQEIPLMGTLRLQMGAGLGFGGACKTTATSASEALSLESRQVALGRTGSSLISSRKLETTAKPVFGSRWGAGGGLRLAPSSEWEMILTVEHDRLKSSLVHPESRSDASVSATTVQLGLEVAFLPQNPSESDPDSKVP